MRRLLGLMLFLILLSAAVLELSGQEDSSLRLTLEEAIEMALEQNPDIAEAQSRLAEAEARVRTARAGNLPFLKARAVYDYWTEDQRLLPATRNGEPGVFGPEIMGAEVAATLPLYAGGRVSAEVASSKWSREAAMAQLTRTREMLAYQVTATFYGLLAQAEVLRSLEAGVQAMEEQQRSVQALVDAEKAARVDLLRVNVRRAELHERVVRERSNRTIQQLALAALLGARGAVVPEVRGELGKRDIVVCTNAADCVQKALGQRADYRAARAAVFAAEAAVSAARSGYLPTVTVQASYAERWMPDPTDQPEGGDDWTDVGRGGLVVEMPIFDGRLTAAKVAEQKARLLGARERFRKLELQIRFEVEAALAEMAAVRERIQTAEQAVGQAEESFRIVREKYDLGKGTLTDVLDAQTAMVSAQTVRARALADLAVAEARCKLAVGEILP